MKIWKVHLRGRDGTVIAGESQGYQYFSSKHALAAFKREYRYADWEIDDVKHLDFSMNTRGILWLLNTHASHPDNG